MKILLPCLWLLVLVACDTPTPASPESCTGTEACGTVADCEALCANVARLGCAAQWGIDPDDGACLELCQNTEPGLCPALGAVQPTCEDIDRVSECGK